MPDLYDPQFVKRLFEEMAGTYGVVNTLSSFGFNQRWRSHLPGYTTSGDSIAEVRLNIKDAVESYLELLREHNEPVPPPRSVTDVVDAG
jgi:hypothetical protein